MTRVATLSSTVAVRRPSAPVAPQTRAPMFATVLAEPAISTPWQAAFFVVLAALVGPPAWMAVVEYLVG